MDGRMSGWINKYIYMCLLPRACVDVHIHARGPGRVKQQARSTRGRRGEGGGGGRPTINAHIGLAKNAILGWGCPSLARPVVDVNVRPRCGRCRWHGYSCE